MPEMLEVEAARQLIEHAALGRRIASVDAQDAWYLKRGLTAHALDAALPGRAFTAARRRGKLLLLDTGGVGPSRAPGPVLALHLGMSGRVVIDGAAAGDPLLYTSNEDRPEWYRFRLHFADGGALALRDPRRLGAVELDPDEDRLGTDALSIDRASLERALGHSRAPLKAVLMDQARIAGLGNLLADEVLWRSGLDPARPAGSLDPDERAVLRRTIRHTVRVLGRRGGSHTGDLMPARLPGGLCPRDGAPLLRRTVGGRTTYSCPVHQV
ncbi:MAG TPA: DNA-formamidopyrimidine glycosylase family protein [Acidimicrobiia bacterium]|jgi:formamidopyrimidine-DNA glycosylase